MIADAVLYPLHFKTENCLIWFDHRVATDVSTYPRSQLLILYVHGSQEYQGGKSAGNWHSLTLVGFPIAMRQEPVKLNAIVCLETTWFKVS